MLELDDDDTDVVVPDAIGLSFSLPVHAAIDVSAKEAMSVRSPIFRSMGASVDQRGRDVQELSHSVSTSRRRCPKRATFVSPQPRT